MVAVLSSLPSNPKMVFSWDVQFFKLKSLNMTAYEDPLGTENYALSMQLLRFLKELKVLLVIICICLKIIIEKFAWIFKIITVHRVTSKKWEEINRIAWQQWNGNSCFCWVFVWRKGHSETTTKLFIKVLGILR